MSSFGKSIRSTLLGAVVFSGCARTAPAEPERLLPDAGPLQLRVVYPPTQSPGGILSRRDPVLADSTFRFPRVDSVFVFGSVTRRGAAVVVNGVRAAVHDGGGWLAWLPLRGDSVARFEIAASVADDSTRAALVVRARPRAAPVAGGWAWIDTTSMRPVGDRWHRPGEGFAIRVRAAAGATVRLLVPGRDPVEFVPDGSLGPLSPGHDAFDLAASPTTGSARAHRYVAWHTGPLGPDPGRVMAPDPPTLEGDSAWAVVEAVYRRDTTRVRWPLRVGIVDPVRPQVVYVDDDPRGTGLTDSILPGRPTPNGTYHWFFPTGTRAAVSGRVGDQVRLQLSRRSVAWVDAGAVLPLRPGTPPPVGFSRPPRLFPDSQSVTLRVPLPGRVPYRVDETDRVVRLRLYGVAADIDWIQYSGTDPFVELIAYEQTAEDEVTLSLHLARAVWGYRTHWAGNDLLLEVRRPPPVDRDRPLRGRHIAVDAGHPPGGSTGPTGVREPEVTLAVARVVETLLEAEGASVTMLRTDASPVGLTTRLATAEASGAELLVSIHANALPDGVNPFANNGTSVYYYYARSAPLARALNRALVARFGERDLGIGRGDLAMARSTWMPAALTEGLFMMIPEQEAVLASPAGQRRYAEGVVDGIAEFLRGRAGQR